MWSGGDDYNDRGETVRLYHAITYGRQPDQTDWRSSYAGGGSHLLDTDGPKCLSCGAATFLLVQLHVPSAQESNRSRTYQVFACNRAMCWRKLFQEGPLCYGGGGVVRCRSFSLPSSLANIQSTRTSVGVAQNPDEAGWTDETVTCENSDGWGLSTDDEYGLDELESKLQEMETVLSSSSQPGGASICSELVTLTQKATPVSRRNEESNQPSFSDSSFRCFELHMLQEPCARKVHGTDDDDVGMCASGTDSDKIQRMLARYMAEEEDEEILAALRGSSDVGGGGISNWKERDERLSAEDRALLTYTDRLKRSPRQVVRYAYGGEPLWSIPVDPIGSNTNKSRKTKGTRASEQTIPPGPLGQPRRFAFQLLPSLLDVLQVDRGTSFETLDSAFTQGGMNWGNIAVYTSCSQASDVSTEEYVVVQDSVEGMPAQNRQTSSMEPLVIADGTDFDDDSGEEDEDVEEADDSVCCEDKLLAQGL